MAVHQDDSKTVFWKTRRDHERKLHDRNLPENSSMTIPSAMILACCLRNIKINLVKTKVAFKRDQFTLRSSSTYVKSSSSRCRERKNKEKKGDKRLHDQVKDFYARTIQRLNQTIIPHFTLVIIAAGTASMLGNIHTSIKQRSRPDFRHGLVRTN
jgi:hypothetical protein